MIQRIIMRLIKFYLAVPKPFRWLLWVLPILYFILPIELVPDYFPIFGRIDDLIIIFLIVNAFNRAGFYEHFFKNARRTGNTRAGSDNRHHIKPPHEVLGVARNADQATIKSAYRKLIKAYHPDRFAHLGPDYEAEAQRKTREIIQAYQAMCPA